MYEYNLQIFRILNILGIFTKGRYQKVEILTSNQNKQIFIVHFLKVELENIDRLLKLVSENSLICLKHHCILYKQIYKYFQGLNSEKEKKEKFQISES